MKTYKINEIFYSIQGEGMYTGFPAIFIRFSGCNRKCEFKIGGEVYYCDTNHQTYDILSGEEILEKINELNTKCNRIILTGGEVLIQLDKHFIDFLHQNNFIVHLETNGDFAPDFIDEIDWVTVSPKESKFELRRGDELKLVYQGQNLVPYENTDFQYYFLQPCSMKNIKETIEVVKKNPKWNLSIQQQKILDIR